MRKNNGEGTGRKGGRPRAVRDRGRRETYWTSDADADALKGMRTIPACAAPSCATTYDMRNHWHRQTTKRPNDQRRGNNRKNIRKERVRAPSQGCTHALHATGQADSNLVTSHQAHLVEARRKRINVMLQQFGISQRA